MTHAFRWLVAVTLLGVTVIASAQQSRGPAQALLQRVIDQADKLTYSGTRTVEFKQGPDRVKHTEYVVRQGERYRAEFGRDSQFAGQIVVENSTNRLHYFPNENEIHVLPPRRDEAYGRMARMLEADQGRFQFELADGGRVANRETSVVTIKDSRGNVLQKLWVDKQTAMLLKREMYDPVGAMMGGFEFTRVNFSPRIRQSDFEIERRGAKRVTPSELLDRHIASGGFQNVRIGANEGFRLEASMVLDRAPQKTLVQTYRSDKTRLSLFQVKGAVDGDTIEQMTRGRTTAVSWTKGGSTFVLIGDLPKSELERLSKRLQE